jgi:hypothetical protein
MEILLAALNERDTRTIGGREELQRAPTSEHEPAFELLRHLRRRYQSICRNAGEFPFIGLQHESRVAWLYRRACAILRLRRQ